MKDFEIISTSFNKKDSINYILSIRLSPDGFSFSVIDSLENSLIALKKNTIDNEDDTLQDDYYCQYMYDFIIKEELFKLSYKRVNIIYITSNSTLVPNSVIEKKHINNLFNNNIDQDTNHQLLENKITSIDATVIYSIPECIYRVVNRQFSNISFYHQSAYLIDAAIDYNTGRDTTVFVHQSEKEIDICILNNGNLLVYNTYKYIKSDDIIYYTFNLVEQISSGTIIDRIILSGEVRKFKELIPNIKKFFSKVEFLQPETRYIVSHEFDKIQLQDFNLLFLNKL